MEIKGTLHKKNDTQVVSEKFKKREFIIKVAGQYPEYLNCQLVNDKCFLLDKISNNDELTIHVNLKGRLWTNKEGVEVAFNTIDVWKIDNINALNDSVQKYAPVDDVPF